MNSKYVSFKEGTLTLSVDKFLKEYETPPTVEFFPADNENPFGTVVFNTTGFIQLNCEDILNVAVCSYFGIDYVDETEESENVVEYLKGYIIENHIDPSNIVLS